ncbi:MAG: hypothetical protein E6I61_14560 [Chloroflexi bacterium]|nr:MAG: hypothetical protein E6I61_14560 [Chloroflexota bacterium]
MTRILVVACVTVLAACGGGSGPSLPVVQGPPSAQNVAQNSSDFPGLSKCSESGSYDSYLKQEQTKAPDQYQSDKTTWDDLKASGANDSYVAVYAANASDCSQFGAGTPSGKVAYVYAIRFKDSSSASASYKASAKDFHLDSSQVTQLQAAGATVAQGTATGLGDNSIVLSIDIAGVAVYVALWQNKGFEVATVAFNEATDAPTATTKINGRIH